MKYQGSAAAGLECGVLPSGEPYTAWLASGGLGSRSWAARVQAWTHLRALALWHDDTQAHTLPVS